MHKVVTLFLVAFFAVSGAHAKEMGQLSDAKCLDTIERVVSISKDDSGDQNEHRISTHVLESHCSVHAALLADFDAIIPILRIVRLNTFVAEIARKTHSSRFHRPPIAQ